MVLHVLCSVSSIWSSHLDLTILASFDVLCSLVARSFYALHNADILHVIVDIYQAHNFLRKSVSCLGIRDLLLEFRFSLAGAENLGIV